MSTYNLIYTKTFKNLLDKALKNGLKLDDLLSVVEKLMNNEKLELKYKDHALIDNKYYQGCRQCKINSNFALVYKYFENKIILVLI